MVIIIMKVKVISSLNNKKDLQQAINLYLFEEKINSENLIDIKFHTQAFQSNQDIMYDVLIIYEDNIK